MIWACVDFVSGAKRETVSINQGRLPSTAILDYAQGDAIASSGTHAHGTARRFFVPYFLSPPRVICRPCKGYEQCVVRFIFCYCREERGKVKRDPQHVPHPISIFQLREAARASPSLRHLVLLPPLPLGVSPPAAGCVRSNESCESMWKAASSFRRTPPGWRCL